jgi:uncharacterized protein (TIGR04255 family)
MVEELYFSKAPIIEALISIEIENLPDLNLGSFEMVDKAYPGQEPIFKNQFTFDVLNTSAKAERTPLGVKATSEDGKQIAQFKTDGFTFSRLAPYNGWDAFSAEARRLWDIYQTLVTKRLVAKALVIRYINKLILPLGPDINEYFNVYTYFPDDYPVRAQNYFLRLEILLNEPVPGVLIMQQAQLPQETPNTLAFLLDNEFRFSLTNSTPPIWELATEIRHLKNATFKRLLTEKTQELIR